MRFVALLVLGIAMLVHARPARADNVSTLIAQLSDDSDKVRLAAAVNLTKLGDGSDKVILALSKTVVNDSDSTVRAAAAVGLGKLVSSKTKPVVKNLAIKNLQAASSDSSSTVKEQANKALAAINGGSGSTTQQTTQSSGGGNGIYVNLGPMSSKTGTANDTKLRAMMSKVAAQTLVKSGPHISTTTQAKGASGFYVDGTLNSLTVKTSGSGATISCKVSMLLAEWPSKNMFGFLNGGASVTAGTSQSDQDLAGQDCVQAVIENLIANKIIPTICTKTSASCP